MIRGAMPQAISIDNFIHAHRDDHGISTCGKLAISAEIIHAERESLLYVDALSGRKMDFSRLSGTWYESIFKLITEDVCRDSVATAFDNVSFITFNYDRCIEHFIYNAIINLETGVGLSDGPAGLPSFN